MAVADFNGDGKLDLAVVDQQISILLGNGDGTFQKPVNIPYSSIGEVIAAADFNGDGKIDLVVAAPNEVVVFLGNGDGTFQAPIVSATTFGASFVAVGDFNSDRKPDLVVVDSLYISVLLGNGDGSFQTPRDNSSFVGGQQLAVGDFNNDHNLDVIAVGFFGGSSNIGVLLGNGDGTLQPSLTYPLNNTPGGVAAADFNHDGNLDVAIGGYFLGTVSIFLGTGNGTFKPEVDYVTPGAGYEVIAYDFNGDGNLDLILSGVGMMLGRGDGTFEPVQVFQPSALVPATSVGELSVGDLNGDKMPDVVSAGQLGAVSLLNTGVVGFAPSTPISFPSQIVNTRSGPKAVTLTNTGSSALSIRSIMVSGNFQGTNTCGSSVAAGASCSLTVTFETPTAGWHQGLVTISDSASSKPQVIELSGLGTALSLSPTALNFGNVQVGKKSAPQQFTVTNLSNSTVKISSVVIIGYDPNDFSQSNNCTPAIGANATCTVNVTFAPTKKGSRSGQAYPNAPGGSQPGFVTLTGVGT